MNTARSVCSPRRCRFCRRRCKRFSSWTLGGDEPRAVSRTERSRGVKSSLSFWLPTWQFGSLTLWSRTGRASDSRTWTFSDFGRGQSWVKKIMQALGVCWKFSFQITHTSMPLAIFYRFELRSHSFEFIQQFEACISDSTRRSASSRSGRLRTRIKPRTETRTDEAHFFS